MHALPFLVALGGAGLVAPSLLRSLADSGHVRPNYRGRELPFPFGLLVAVVAPLVLVALVPIDLAGEVGLFERGFERAALYAFGVLLLGLVDDAFGGPADGPRGWRGHARAILAGRFSTGALKAVGSLGLAFLVAPDLELGKGHWLLGAGVLVLATNLFNLLDLRPGRATKIFVGLGAILALCAQSLVPLWTIGPFAGPALVAGAYDLRERAMLGDTGANLIGALAGIWLVLSMSVTAQWIALGVLLAITIYGELRSISSLIEKTPGVRAIDSWGRPS